MLEMFDVPKIKVFGSFGEFTIGDGSSTLRAKYILTKIRPGNDGTSPESALASQMRPWREVFNIEQLDFNQLLQRDLDDSRVAHDLIPYLLEESGKSAKFFPPILAVIVPRKQVGPGIEPFYPTLNVQDESVEKYGDLFDFERMKWDGKLTPLAKLSYNRERSAFVIVDGQHRAMAVLALHRQLNENWGNNPFESYYDHVSVTPEQVNNIELPTCIIYFPDLHQGNLNLKQGIDLSSVCREIFLVVNRTAKHVSESRAILLDDEDIAAHLMRETLSKVKDRGEEPAGLARIYSISYGDSDMETGQREVISGQLEYSSAITLHKIHRAISFGPKEAFEKIDCYVDISDGRRTQNKNRPSEILLGTDVEHLDPLEYNSGKLHLSREVKEVVKKLGKLTDEALGSLFDEFRPFKVHNNELQNLKMKLSDVYAKSDRVQKKAYTLIFEGSGVRNVFESHFKRLKKEKQGRLDSGQRVPDYLEKQIQFCQSVNITLNNNKQEFQHFRACKFFSINYDVFYRSDSDNQTDQEKLEDKDQKLFQTLATQAFQLGYAMAIFIVVEELRKQSTVASFPYSERLQLVQFVTKVYLTALNAYFSPQGDTVHRTLNGYINEGRASVFDLDALGLRGLLKMSVNELNERQWRFFRYTILEIVHSPFCWDVAQEKMNQIGSERALAWYKAAIPRIVDGIISEREKYIKDAINAAVKDSNFQLDVMQKKGQAKGEGKNEKQIQKIVKELETTRKEGAEKRAREHLKESLGTVEEKKDMVKRLSTGL